MSRSAISRVTITATGYNLTDQTDSDTMSTGTGNGVEIPYNPNDVIVLINSTGGPATYTFVMPQPTAYSDQGATIPDVDVSVADGKTYLHPMQAIYKQSDGNVYVDCDVAADIMVMAR